MNNLLMAFAPCQQLCWRKWSLWSPPGHQEVKDRQRDHRIPFCEAATSLQGAGWCGGLPNTRVTHCPKSQLGDPIPTSNKQELDLSCTGSFITGVRRGVEMGWRLRFRVHGQEGHHSSSAGPWSSTYPHCNRRQQIQHPFIHLLFTLLGTNLAFLFPHHLFSPEQFLPTALPVQPAASPEHYSSHTREVICPLRI